MILSSPRVGPDVYKVLIGELAHSQGPTAIMGLTLTGVALLAGAGMEDPWLILTAVLAGLATIGKLALMASQRRRALAGAIDLADARSFERSHRIATLVTAGCVAGIASLFFLHRAVEWHVLATALLFAYCAGVIGRLSIWPPLALPALMTAVVPVILVSAIWSDTPHRVTSLMFGVFLAGSFETVRHVYRRATRHIATELDLATLARHDPLTGLSNRLGFREAFRALATGSDGRLAMHCLDLDGFKGVNDRFGHAAGDILLVEVARRVNAAAPGAVTARLGGDEFAVLQVGISHVAGVSALADAVVTALREPFVIEGAIVTIGASLGYTVAASETADFETMLRTADATSYRIKRAGGGAGMAGPEDVTAPKTMHQLHAVA